MITIDINLEGMTEIQEKLAKLSPSEARSVLKKSVNETAKYAKKLVAEKGYSTYKTKKSNLTQSMSIENAVASKPVARVKSVGKVNTPLKYRATPTSFAQQQHRKLAAKVQVLRSGNLKALEVDGRKAFYTVFTNKNGAKHEAIAQRVGRERLPIKTIMSPSFPVALMSTKNAQKVRPLIRSELIAALERHIEEVL